MLIVGFEALPQQSLDAVHASPGLTQHCAWPCPSLLPLHLTDGWAVSVQQFDGLLNVLHPVWPRRTHEPPLVPIIPLVPLVPLVPLLDPAFKQLAAADVLQPAAWMHANCEPLTLAQRLAHCLLS